VAVATVASEPYAVSAAVGLGSEAVWIGELPVPASAIGVSAMLEVGELSEAASIPGELRVADSAIRVSAAVGLGELTEAIWIDGELLVADSAVAGVGDAATEGVFG
jgi:hypothetical protein